VRPLIAWVSLNYDLDPVLEILQDMEESLLDNALILTRQAVTVTLVHSNMI
jgi:hypothetical protein